MSLTNRREAFFSSPHYLTRYFTALKVDPFEYFFENKNMTGVTCVRMDLPARCCQVIVSSAALSSPGVGSCSLCLAAIHTPVKPCREGKGGGVEKEKVNKEHRISGRSRFSRLSPFSRGQSPRQLSALRLFPFS